MTWDQPTEGVTTDIQTAHYGQEFNYQSEADAELPHCAEIGM